MEINTTDRSEAVAGENCAKRLKLSDDSAELKLWEIGSFKDFVFKRVLNEDISSKTIYLEGKFKSVDGSAVVILEKQAFGKDSVRQILTEETVLENNFVNDIYGSYKGFPKSELNAIKTTVIHPASKQHIKKYAFQPLFVVSETPELYNNVVLPHLKCKQFSLEWVYNILEHKSEAERIIFEDPDPETGFVLLPDLKWNESEISDLYVIAICHRKGIKSLRDLTSDHLPLLKNMLLKGTSAIETKYKIPKCKLRIYIHYQPSYYHFHVHFTNVSYNAPGIQTDRAHLLERVINNIELLEDYYQKANLTYSLKQSDTLFAELEKAHAFQ